MPNQYDDKSSLDYLLDKIFANLESIVDRMDDTDKETNEEFKELKEEVEKAKAESRKLLDHISIIDTLGQNLSPEGLKELIQDVSDCKTYIIQHRAAEEAKEKAETIAKADKKESSELWKKITENIAPIILGALLAALGVILKKALGI